MAEPSGPVWCARFPGSQLTADLLPAFRTQVEAFLAAMRRSGATVTVGATFRPPERAYLMHWCCLIADSGQDPTEVPAMPGVDIDWGHGGDINAARAAAHAMKNVYGIQYPAALTSRHTQRRAIDMTIAWNGTLSIADAAGAAHAIAQPPHDGLNPDLIRVGATYGVIKLVKDPPHWSDDGH